MSQPLKKSGLGAALHDDGRVVEARAGRYTVRTERGRITASRAASCLLEPAPGDRVLLAWLADGAVFVLAVLERDESQRARVSLPGNAEVLAEGRLVLHGADGVSIASPNDVSIASSAVTVCADEATVSAGKITTTAAFVLGQLGKIKVVAEACDQIFERFSQHVQRAYRRADEFDQVRAGRIDYAAESTAQVHGGNTVVSAEELVKVDASQVHLG